MPPFASDPGPAVSGEARPGYIERPALGGHAVGLSSFRRLMQVVSSSRMLARGPSIGCGPATLARLKLWHRYRSALRWCRLWPAYQRGCRRRMGCMLKAIPAVLVLMAGSLTAAEGLVALVDPLDEPERYCLDVPGWGRRLNLDAPLMAHTCKPGAADELFTPNHPGPGQLYMKAYDRCATAESSEPGSEIYLKSCDSSELQRFSFERNGRIRLADSDVCLTVADGKGTPTGGPSHLRRDLLLEPCSSADPVLSRWEIPERSD